MKGTIDNNHVTLIAFGDIEITYIGTVERDVMMGEASAEYVKATFVATRDRQE